MSILYLYFIFVMNTLHMFYLWGFIEEFYEYKLFFNFKVFRIFKKILISENKTK